MRMKKPGVARATSLLIALAVLGGSSGCGREPGAPTRSHIETPLPEPGGGPPDADADGLPASGAPSAVLDGSTEEPDDAERVEGGSSASEVLGVRGSDDARGSGDGDTTPFGAETTTAPTGEPDEAASARPRATLKRAYIDIYCAQRRGETRRLRAIYAEYGFSDPRDWRREWEKATKDREWLASVTRAALETCP